jgi:hypothetical protein
MASIHGLAVRSGMRSLRLIRTRVHFAKYMVVGQFEIFWYTRRALGIPFALRGRDSTALLSFGLGIATSGMTSMGMRCWSV